MSLIQIVCMTIIGLAAINLFVAIGAHLFGLDQCDQKKPSKPQSSPYGGNPFPPEEKKPLSAQEMANIYAQMKAGNTQ